MAEEVWEINDSVHFLNFELIEIHLKRADARHQDIQHDEIDMVRLENIESAHSCFSEPNAAALHDQDFVEEAPILSSSTR